VTEQAAIDIRIGRPRPPWFTEGFATRDLQDTKALLDDLA